MIFIDKVGVRCLKVTYTTRETDISEKQRNIKFDTTTAC